MASFKLLLALFLSSLFLHSALADITCEELPKDACAFAIASTGNRCLLETYTSNDGTVVDYQCRTSNVKVEKMSNHIENDDCVKACGVDRNSVGISSDSLLEPHFTSKLCSPDCYQNCPNIVDLYFNLAVGEGAYLPDICEASRTNPHRSVFQIMSSGAAAAPASLVMSQDEVLAGAPL